MSPRKASRFICFVLAASLYAVQAEELDRKNFDLHVFEAGRRALVLFHEPDCDGCEELMATWARMKQKYQESYSVFVGTVDCSEQHRICQENIYVNDLPPELPVIKWYTPKLPRKSQSYIGKTTFTALDHFAEQELARKCEPYGELDHCDDQEKKFIEEQQRASPETRNRELERLGQVLERSGGRGLSSKLEWLHKRIVILRHVTEQDRNPHAEVHDKHSANYRRKHEEL